MIDKISPRILWKPAAIGILAVWKIGQNRFHVFLRSRMLYRRDTIANMHFEQVITETLCSISAPHGHISVEATTEVEVVTSSTTSESIAHYQEKMEEVDTMIEAIDAVEELYWGDIFV